VEKMMQREEELLHLIWERFDKIPNLHVLADNHRERLGVISFYIDDLHYNLGVKILNDRFGVQVRGGCSCAGTYGHYLLHVSQDFSRSITEKINIGDLSAKPGWIRMSIHPVMTNEELNQTLDAIEALAEKHEEWAKDYEYSGQTNEFKCTKSTSDEMEIVQKWFEKQLI
ncbi:MAG: cysteine desulfurase, partial [Saprospiraceae bacterium]|nr:cysteine desulfurase [Saprospiraceae bacterium]